MENEIQLDLSHYKSELSLKNRIARGLWMFVWAILFRPTPGVGFRKWRIFLLKLFGADVQWSSNVLPSCSIWQPWKLKMGKFATLSENVNCYNTNWVILGDQATVSRDVFLCPGSHDISSPKMHLITSPMTIQRNAWVCARAVVMSGITIGEGAVIGCSAVVSKDVEPWAVMFGNPAQFVKRRVLRADR